MAEYSGEHIVCIVTGAPGATLHHIISQGAGGQDIETNLLPVCHRVHVEIHKKGLVWASIKYPEIAKFLTTNGWKLVTDNLNRQRWTFF